MSLFHLVQVFVILQRGQCPSIAIIYCDYLFFKARMQDSYTYTNTRCSAAGTTTGFIIERARPFLLMRLFGHLTKWHKVQSVSHSMHFQDGEARRYWT